MLKPLSLLRYVIANPFIFWCAILFVSLSFSLSVSANDTSPLLDMTLEELLQVSIVTGRVGTGVAAKVEASYSITLIDENSLRMQAPTSVVDAVKSVPGFWVESSGGDASENIRARGVPNSGFQSVNLLEDGVPVQHDPYPNGLTSDQSFRLDETIDHIEVVRGGPSSIFYSYAPAGVINFIPRKVGNSAAGLAKYTLGDDGIKRADVWYGSPLGDGWKGSVGGFYRQGEGVRDPGYSAYKGGQIRLGLSRDLSEGVFSVDLKHMDDIVPFYLGGPMQKNASGKIVAVAGFNINSGNYVGPELQQISLERADGSRYDFNSADGTHVRRDQFTSKFEHALGGDWSITQSLRLADELSQRNDVVPLSIISTQQFLLDQTPVAANFGVGQLQLLQAKSLQPFAPANSLLMTANVSNNASDFKSLDQDLQLHREFDFYDQAHDLTLGYSYAYYRQQVDQVGAVVLLGAGNQGRLVAVAGTDSLGQQRILSDADGVFRQGADYAADSASVASHALYFSDEWQVNSNLRIDLGLRWEQAVTRGRSPVLETLNLGSYAKQDVLAASGEDFAFDRRFSHSGWTLGANYQLQPHSGIFARVTPTYRLPGLNNYIPNASSRTQNIQTMTLSEVGYKYTHQYFQFYPTVFYTTYDNVTNNSRIYSAITNLPITQRGFATTRTLGLELEGKFTPDPLFDLAYSATWQHARYAHFSFTNTVNGSTSALLETDYSGNQLIRIPELNYRLVPGVNLLEGQLRLQLSCEYAGKRFVDTANKVVLPSYYVLGAAAHYQVSSSANVFFYIDNLTNSEGLTEGNPRAGEIQSADVGANTFLARAILGRTLRLALKYDF